MSRAAAYRDQLLALQPPGALLPTDPESNWGRLLLALAAELAYVDARMQQLVTESDPRAAAEMLVDWERLLALPDPCTPAGQTLPERRQAIAAKYTARGGQSRAFFLALAERLGYAISIEEYRPFVCGLSECGVDPLDPPEVRFIWTVRIHGPRLNHFRLGESELGVDPLLSITNAQDLECLLHRLKPAHLQLHTAYEG